MKKYFKIDGMYDPRSGAIHLETKYGTKDNAIDAATVFVNKHRDSCHELVILEAVTVVKSPMPPLEVVDIK